VASGKMASLRIGEQNQHVFPGDKEWEKVLVLDISD